jgi:hypothetical protein
MALEKKYFTSGSLSWNELSGEKVHSTEHHHHCDKNLDVPDDRKGLMATLQRARHEGRFEEESCRQRWPGRYPYFNRI